MPSGKSTPMLRVVVDLVGDTLAVVELGTGQGYPGGYYPGRIDWEMAEPTGRPQAFESESVFEPPEPTGRWSTALIRTVLEDTEAFLGR